MHLNEYQNLAKETAIYKDKIIYPTLGLCGEAGEIAEKVKKMLRDEGGNLSEEKRMALMGELGDVMWYIAALATDLGFSLNDIGANNIKKLHSRKERGVIQGNGDNR